MVHLRIVVPAHQAEHVLELFEGTSSACNLAYLKGVARRPTGDVILCDIAREEASLLIADLRELDVDTEGSIAIESIESEVSRTADEAERAAGGHRDPVVWEEVSSRTASSVELTPTFVLFMTFAMLIAGVGIYFGQPILIVGAMVVGPDFGPIAGACVGLVSRRGDLARRSLTALAVGFPVGIVGTLLATLALKAIGAIPGTIDFDAHALTRFITEPDFFSLYVALLAGTVGMLSLTAAKSGALVGVLISVATIPAAANIGVAAAYADWSILGAAALQLVANLLSIFAAGMLTLFVQRRAYMRRRREHLKDGARLHAGLPLGRSRRARVGPGSEPGAH